MLDFRRSNSKQRPKLQKSSMEKIGVCFGNPCGLDVVSEVATGPHALIVQKTTSSDESTTMRHSTCAFGKVLPPAGFFEAPHVCTSSRVHHEKEHRVIDTMRMGLARSDNQHIGAAAH